MLLNKSLLEEEFVRITKARIFTHGDKHVGTPNPRMTNSGMAEVAKRFWDFVPKHVEVVVASGMGARHLDVALALGLRPAVYSDVFGGPSSLEMVDGQKLVILADGSWCTRDQFRSPEHSEFSAPAAIAELGLLGENIVICAGRPLIIALGGKFGFNDNTAKKAAVYEVTVVTTVADLLDHKGEAQEFEYSYVIALSELTATGVTEKSAV